MLANMLLKAWRKWIKVPVWSFVSDVCGVGSNSAMEICEEIGLDPHEKVNSQTFRKIT